jgi:hypothetical protein
MSFFGKYSLQAATIGDSPHFILYILGYCLMHCSYSLRFLLHFGDPMLALTLAFKQHSVLSIFLLSSVLAGAPSFLHADENDAGVPHLMQAAICEKVIDLKAINSGVVFPIRIGELSCFTFFDPVPEPVTLIHHWYYYDRLMERIWIPVRPPRWGAYSTLHLRATDKGAWRVEIADSEGHVFHILRFSVVE